MAQENDVTVQNYNASLISTSILSGNNQNLFLNSFGGLNRTTVTENNNSLQVGETVQLGDGRTATVLGSGTAQPGVNVLGLTVPTGTRNPVVLLQASNGQFIFLYPEGAPNILGIVALVVNIRPVDYTFPRGIICFASGTLIDTPDGPVAVENLSTGDLVMTRDDGPQPLAWVGASAVDAIDLQLRPNLRPVRIKAGALGGGKPVQDLVVSPQHRVLVRSKIAERMLGEEEVLVAAKQLLDIPGVEIADDVESVTYHHIMFHEHQIVMSNGAETESLFTGPEALKSVSAEARKELLALFPDLSKSDNPDAGARKFVPGRVGRRLAARHAQNSKPIVN
ncbi:MAG: Hint domain-containing protein [Loktanella sp.]|nr:Hint domain-containing protein [Loktanella sp.]